MLMFVFGAGASYDSDPERRPGNVEPLDGWDFRPPLAKGLFTPNNDEGQAVISAFPRAAALLMRLRQATRDELDVEEVLEQIALLEPRDPAVAVDLLAFRAYLARLMDEVPTRWLDECHGLTNYVLALDEARRWNAAVNSDHADPIACVTFNYDALLEDAVHRVYGHRIDGMNSYTEHPGIHVLKPHGSVHWRLPAAWNAPAGRRQDGAEVLGQAIDQAPSLRWGTDGTWGYERHDRYRDDDDPTTVWLPALSIPVRQKADFTMPLWHRADMVKDLGRVTTLIAVGWRARERHFLQLLQDELPSQPTRLVAVAESDEAAHETIDNLWETGRFDRYAISGIGFSGFTETPSELFQPRPDWGGHTALTLRHVLTSREGLGMWTTLAPGRGLTPEPEASPSMDPGYSDL